MPSSWGTKLDKKLRGLADSASKESIQTVAIWVAFNRKHAAVIAQVFCDNLKSCAINSTRQWLFWQILHELLVYKHADPTKWDKLLDLRTAIGDNAAVPAIEALGSNVVAAKIEPFLKEWEEHNVFGGPTLVSQIRRMLLSAASKDDNAEKKTESATTTATTTPATPTAAASSSTPKEPEATTAATPASESSAKNKAESTKSDASASRRFSFDSSSQKRRLSLSSLTGDVEYDFESKNVPKGKVDSREFLDPCKAIATLQIARDLRNDTAVQLSSLLSTLPKDILEVCQENDKDSITKENVHDFSMRIPSKILDLDLEEQIQTVKTFQELIKQQQAAREQLIFLLLKSRCHFGSEPAAKAFMDSKDVLAKLERRKILLGDALELEGLDSEIDTTDFEKELNDLAPLTWYKPEDAEAEEATPSNKKARIS